MTNKHHWLKASTQCQVFSMTLAAAKDVSDVHVFHGLMQEFNSQGGAVTAAWLDGTDMLSSSNSWYCPSHGAACPVIPWLPGEPNSASENCVCLWPGHPDGVNDCTCTASLPFICEFNPRLMLERQTMIFEVAASPPEVPIE